MLDTNQSAQMSSSSSNTHAGKLDWEEQMIFPFLLCLHILDAVLFFLNFRCCFIYFLILDAVFSSAQPDEYCVGLVCVIQTGTKGLYTNTQTMHCAWEINKGSNRHRFHG